MAARKDDGKARASRIPLDYYKKDDAITRGKVALSGLAVLAAIGWWATGFTLGGSRGLYHSDSGRLRASHGPLARVHATWDARCEACHVPFRPITENAWATTFGLSAEGGVGKCRSCHASVEDHHADAQKAGDPVSLACAGCHRDHQGREASLVRLADSGCTSCHANLQGHTGTGASQHDNIAAFAADHPEFDLIAKNMGDPGTLRFNHALHMSAGLNVAKGGKPIFTVARLDAGDRDRYTREGQEPTDGVRLECASCHRPENGDLPPASSPLGTEAAASVLSSGTGAYMRPISYQTECSACHKLEVTVNLGPGTTRVLVPHRLQPPDLHRWLTNASIGLSLGKDLKALEQFAPSGRPLPGKPNDAEQSTRAEVASRVAKAERILLGRGKGTCTECHQYKTPSGLTSTLDPSLPLDEARVEPTFVETIWYKRARFDHSAHRAISCRSCHEGAYPDSAVASLSERDVLIPGKDSCVTCHAPEGRDADANPTGGAGHSCTECHRYHGGKHAPGASPPDDPNGMDFARFLGGRG